MDTRASYDRVADEYVRRIFDELKHKPIDRRLLDRFAASVSEAGPACDMGCGPGHVARYLHARGVQICGVDLSTEMVEPGQVSLPFIPSSTSRAPTSRRRSVSFGESSDRAVSCS